VHWSIQKLEAEESEESEETVMRKPKQAQVDLEYIAERYTTAAIFCKLQMQSS
jgi:hypothetical protein